MSPANLGAVRRLLLTSAVLASFAADATAQVVERGRTFADLTASHPCASGFTDRIARVTDCDAADDIGDGGGAFQCWARCDGTAPWEAVSIGAAAGAGVSDGDKGDITVASSGAAWTVDANAIALGTDTTGGYASSATEAGEANALAPAVVIEGTTADSFEGNFAFTDPTADWTWTWGATGTVSGVPSITGGTSGTSTLTLDGDSTVAGVGTVTADGRFKAGVIGGPSAPAFELSAGNAGMYDDWGGAGGVAIRFAPTRSFSIIDNTTYKLYLDADEIQIPVGMKFGWGTIGGAHDTGLVRDAAGIIAITNGNGGSGTLHFRPAASPPRTCDATAEGDVYADTSHALCYCDGTSWNVLTGSGAGACS